MHSFSSRPVTAGHNPIIVNDAQNLGTPPDHAGSQLAADRAYKVRLVAPLACKSQNNPVSLLQSAPSASLSTPRDSKHLEDIPCHDIEIDFHPEAPPQPTPKPGPTPHEFAPIRLSYWPDLNASQWVNHMDYALIYAANKPLGLPNRLGARITLPSGLNLSEWDRALAGYHDTLLVDYLRYGWPSGYTAHQPPTPVHKNHSTADKYQKQVEAFIKKELEMGGLLGPFTDPPFTPWSHVSPLMTAPKKESDSRRIIVDMSFPEDHSVNSGITKNVMEGEYRPYSLPSVADLVTKATILGRSAYLWKADLARAYRQLRIDVMDLPLLGFKHQGLFYTEACPSFGSRLSSSACQRMSNAVIYLLGRSNVWALAYLDDYCGAALTLDQAQHDYQAFLSLAKSLGLQLSPAKCTPPARCMDWLGFQLDTEKMTLTIPPAKMEHIMSECSDWLDKKRATKKDIQSIVDQLVHVGKCIPPARRFLARILETLRHSPDVGYIWLTNSFRADISWFHAYAKNANGIHLLQPTREEHPMECDSSMEGGGGASDTQYYHLTYDNSFKALYPDIVHREAINLLIAYRTLAPVPSQGMRIVIYTDNIGSQQALQSGRTKDRILATCARQIWAEAAIHDHVFDIRHKYGKDIPLADSLSRQHIPAMVAKAAGLVATRKLEKIDHVSPHPYFHCV